MEVMKEIHLIAHNIRSAENIGSLLRTSDALGIGKVWLSGYSPTPEHPRVLKTALGAEMSVAWEPVTDILEILAQLRREDFRIVGLEIDRRAIPLTEYRASQRVAILLGNEVEGITPSLLDACDDVVSIQQYGIKESLNVSVAAAIAAHWMLNT